MQDRQFDLISKTLVLYSREIGEKKITILPKLVTHTPDTHRNYRRILYYLYTEKFIQYISVCFVNFNHLIPIHLIQLHTFYKHHHVLYQMLF